MSWLFGSSKPQGQSHPSFCPDRNKPTAPPHPCCVCKTEKTARDDCMLFSKTDDPTQECKSMIDQYKACMAGYGFKV
ncbi:putative cytochrome c oxidase copper chaperone Cox17 [Aspergillus violaceofuscus CBS 115571]|uniref:Putative cytochrome c oxidase copper chaperone Cox17 n=1 Tax=Aspergillus violaceofuscus (strain CBS 115571) TaxID=1450538 RepID=A0A2V5GV56_ASPV1|nr:putative cytochrome c oxidase copper chaperone Cox17 [Aspergillus violaceofuscus CBS 115571]